MELSFNFPYGWSLLVYRNISAFCMLILWPADFLSVFVVSTSKFMVDSLQDFIYRYIYIWNHATCDIVYFFLSDLDAFLFLLLV